MADSWVDVVMLQGEDYAEIADLGVEEMVEHLARWDYGEETDHAHTCARAPWGSSDRIYEVSYGGLTYVLAVNHRLGYASLNRRPLTHS